MRECEEKLKSVHLARPRDWILRLTVGKLPKEAHVWSMQKSWSVALTRALQDKTSSLTKQLAHDLDSRLSQVARLSCQTTLFGKNWPFDSKHTPVKYPLYPHIVESFQREFWERNPREKQDWLIHNFHPFILQILLLSSSPLLHPWNVHLAKSFSHHIYICENVI